MFLPDASYVLPPQQAVAIQGLLERVKLRCMGGAQSCPEAPELLCLPIIDVNQATSVGVTLAPDSFCVIAGSADPKVGMMLAFELRGPECSFTPDNIQVAMVDKSGQIKTEPFPFPERVGATVEQLLGLYLTAPPKTEVWG